MLLPPPLLYEFDDASEAYGTGAGVEVDVLVLLVGTTSIPGKV